MIPENIEFEGPREVSLFLYFFIWLFYIIMRAGGWGAGQVLVGSSVEGHLSEYATIPCLGLPVFSATVSDY